MKKKLIIGLGLSSVVLLIFIFLFFYNQQFSITELNADNFEEKLLVNNLKERIDADKSETLSLDLLASDNPDRINFYSVWDSNAVNYNYKIEKKTGKNGVLLIEVFLKGTNQNFYNIYFNSKMQPISFMMNLNSGITLKPILNSLIIKEGFILKKSLIIKGHDIIIKETEKAFIIGELFNKYDELTTNDNSRYQIIFQIFSKKKYF